MNDSPTNLSKKNSAAAAQNRQPVAAAPPSAVKAESREVMLESQTENISLPPDKLNDLFLEAELTARQKPLPNSNGSESKIKSCKSKIKD